MVDVILGYFFIMEMAKNLVKFCLLYSEDHHSRICIKNISKTILYFTNICITVNKDFICKRALLFRIFGIQNKMYKAVTTNVDAIGITFLNAFRIGLFI